MSANDWYPTVLKKSSNETWKIALQSETQSHLSSPGSLKLICVLLANDAEFEA